MTTWKRCGLLLLVAILMLTSCGTKGTEIATEEGTLIYFLSDDRQAKGGDFLCGSYEDLGLDEDVSLRDTASAVVERTLLGSQTDPDLRSPLPSGIQLQSLEIIDRRAYVDLSAGFGQLSGVDLTLADYCLTLSLTALEGISAVVITAAGRQVIQQPKQVFYERDVLLSNMDDVLQSVVVTLWFCDADGVLTGEQRVLEIYEGQTQAENLMTALLRGPENRDLQRIIPESLVVNSVRMEGNICYVNFSAASLEQLPSDETQQMLILRSIADSIYSLSTVEEIRLLADSAELETFGFVPVSSVEKRP